MAAQLLLKTEIANHYLGHHVEHQCGALTEDWVTQFFNSLIYRGLHLSSFAIRTQLFFLPLSVNFISFFPCLHLPQMIYSLLTLNLKLFIYLYIQSPSKCCHQVY